MENINVHDDWYNPKYAEQVIVKDIEGEGEIAKVVNAYESSAPNALPSLPVKLFLAYFERV